MATKKKIDLAEHHQTIEIACAQLIKSLDTRDPQQRVLVKSAIAVIDQIEQTKDA